MNNVRIVPAQSKHINRIANRMREIDARECVALGHTPKQALRRCWSRSSIAWTALVDEQPEAMFGVVVQSVLDAEGAPWFLGTDEVYRHGKAMISWGPGIISRLHNSNLRLSNVVCCDNTKAIRLLRKWGFTVHADRQEIGGEMFHQFDKEPA